MIVLGGHVPLGDVGPLDGGSVHAHRNLTPLVSAVEEIPCDRAVMLNLLAVLLVETDRLR